MKSLSDHRSFILHTLSPVHVGSGRIAKNGIEIQGDPVDSGRFLVIDMEAALDALSAEDARQFRGVKSIADLLLKRDVPREAFCYHVLPGFSAEELRMALRDGAGRPILPGSSLKGAVRTAFLATWVGRERALGRDPVSRALPTGGQPKFAAKAIERACFHPSGEDNARTDLFRTVTVTDASFPAESLGVVFVKTNSPSAYDVRRMKEFSTAVETLGTGCEAEVEIHLDGYLLGDAGKNLSFDRRDLSFSNLTAWLREHFFKQLEAELTVLQQRGWSAAVTQLAEIRRVVEEHRDGLPLRMGWGIGWCGTTGALVPESERLALLRKFDKPGGNRMGKLPSSAYASMVFPKSRRFANAETDPSTLGWVLLRPTGGASRPLPPPLPRYEKSTLGGAPPTPSTSISEVARETWTKVDVSYNKGGGGVLSAVGPGGLKAEARQEACSKVLAALAPDARERLAKKGVLRGVAVELTTAGAMRQIAAIVLAEPQPA